MNSKEFRKEGGSRLFEVLSQRLSGVTEKTHEQPVRITGVPSEHHLNINLLEDVTRETQKL
jgi:hypothetical protein